MHNIPGIVKIYVYNLKCLELDALLIVLQAIVH